jgi:glucuronate isomerase
MGQSFIHPDFLLHSKTAVQLYHEYAAGIPIIDYHNHLPPQQIAADMNFKNITQIWLQGDHYKWRAMRANGINEKYITGNGSDEEKFMNWAATVPATLRNPLYHWSHLELKRYFEVDELLHEKNADAVYTHCNVLLQTQAYSVRNLLRKMNVQVVCTTDDPCDTLEHHQNIKQDGFEIKVLPAFRPDKALLIGDGFINYIAQLGMLVNKNIRSTADLLDALQQRIDFFHEQGCRISDHGLNYIPPVSFTATEIETIFSKAESGKEVTPAEADKYLLFMLVHLCKMYHAKGWVQQFHLGALRNNNTRLQTILGTDCGADSIGDFKQAKGLSGLLNHLDTTNQLAKTILYNLNPADNEVFAAMTGNHNDGTVKGKIQWGSSWWFLDQKDGMEKQINALSNMSLLSRFIGMLTDSRSFMSFPRHEYFRRVLCNLLGNEMEKGELPADNNLIGLLVKDICYYNAKNYFNL